MKIQHKHYFSYYVLLFFISAFVGWLWEALLYIIMCHSFINRGMCYGPYLPVYGIGSVMLMLFFKKFRKHPVLIFFISAFACTVLEYFTGLWLMQKWQLRWWDYSENFLNIGGHICLSSTIGFGMGGVFLICIFQPFFNRLYHKMTIFSRITLCLILITIFIADATYSISSPNTGPYINTIKYS